MPCCHVDFAFTETSDKAFTVGMPTFTFGAGCLAEAGDHARELSLTRVALFTDRVLAASPYLATVRASLEAAGIAPTIYDEVAIEPSTLAAQALLIMEQRKITSLVVAGENLRVEGVLHLHNLWRTELF